MLPSFKDAEDLVGVAPTLARAHKSSRGTQQSKLESG